MFLAKIGTPCFASTIAPNRVVFYKAPRTSKAPQNSTDSIALEIMFSAIYIT